MTMRGALTRVIDEVRVNLKYESTVYSKMHIKVLDLIEFLQIPLQLCKLMFLSRSKYSCFIRQMHVKSEKSQYL